MTYSYNTVVDLTIITLTLCVLTSEAGYCASYCSEANDFKAGFKCSEATPNPYCCGDVNDRYCCSNQSLDITDKYEDVCYFCFSSPCSLYGDWTKVLGAMAAVLSIVMLSVCLCHCIASCQCSCCRCCERCERHRHRLRRLFPSCCNKHNSQTSPTNSIGSMSEVQSVSRQASVNGQGRGRVVTIPPVPEDFDPDHPFAFRPPDYDGLADSPPKYDDLETNTTTTAAPSGEGHDNPGFVIDIPPPRSPPSDTSGDQLDDDTPPSYDTLSQSTSGVTSPLDITSGLTLSSDNVPSVSLENEMQILRRADSTLSSVVSVSHA